MQTLKTGWTLILVLIVVAAALFSYCKPQPALDIPTCGDRYKEVGDGIEGDRQTYGFDMKITSDGSNVTVFMQEGIAVIEEEFTPTREGTYRSFRISYGRELRIAMCDGKLKFAVNTG